MSSYPSQKVVTVCDRCLTETCFKGQFPCAGRLSGDANSITDTEENIGHLLTTTRHLEIEKTPSGLENSQPLNKFKTQLHCITGAVSELETLRPESDSAQ